MKEYVYYWYHHMMDDKTRKEVEKALYEKDYFKFLEFYKTLNAKGLLASSYYEEFEAFCPTVFLPDKIYIFEGNDIIDAINILERKNFNKITSIECECG